MDNWIYIVAHYDNAEDKKENLISFMHWFVCAEDDDKAYSEGHSKWRREQFPFGVLNDYVVKMPKVETPDVKCSCPRCLGIHDPYKD